MKIINIILLLFILVICFSCKKNQDDSAPVITIIKPYENQQFSALDTINVTVTVEDETELKQIDITLTDENKIPVLQTNTIFPQNKSVTITTPYELNDIDLTSGSYYIRVRASDGTNIHDAYRSININEVPQELNSVYILTYENSTTIHALRKTPSGIPQQLFDINGDYSSSAASSKLQLYYTCGKIYGDLHAYSVTDEMDAWSVPVVSNPPFPYFENIGCYNNIPYVSFYDGYIKGYNKNGNTTFTALAPIGYYPVKVAVSSNYLFADHARYSGSSRMFGVYYLGSGMMKQQIVTDYELLGIFEKDNDNAFLFGNQGSQAVMRIYNITDNGTWEPHTFPTEKIKDVLQIDANKYIIALESGTYFYNYTNNSLISYIGESFTHIKFDGTTSEIYASAGKDLKIYDYASHTLLNSVSVADSIIDFQFIFN